jgi:very-short-patch-repair endonuclease
MHLVPGPGLDDEPTILLRREAIESGMSDASLRQAVRAGLLVRVRHGAYVEGAVWAAADQRERHLIVARAVHRTHGDRVAFSHHTAAVLHGLDLWRVDLGKLHVTRADGKHGRHAGDLIHHEGSLASGDVQVVRGLPVVPPARAALESASLVSVEQGLVTVDSALAKGLCDREAIQQRRHEIEGWPDSLGLQVVVALCDARHQSAGESRTAHLIWRANLPRPVPQYEVRRDGLLIGTVDFAWPELGVILEFDGRVKYEKYLREGETAADAVVREKKREDRIREATGWIVIRVTWAELADPHALVARIRRAMRRAAA